MNNLSQELSQIVYQGWLQKQSRVLKTWRKRWFVLTPRFLLSFKQQTNYKDPTERIQLNNIIRIGAADQETHRQFSLKVETAQDCFLLAGTSKGECERWLGEIGRAMLKSQQLNSTNM